MDGVSNLPKYVILLLYYFLYVNARLLITWSMSGRRNTHSLGVMAIVKPNALWEYEQGAGKDFTSLFS